MPLEVSKAAKVCSHKFKISIKGSVVLPLVLMDQAKGKNRAKPFCGFLAIFGNKHGALGHYLRSIAPSP